MWRGYLVCATFIGLGLLSTTHPTNAVSGLQSFELDMNTGALVLTFSEPVNADTLDPTQVILQDSQTFSATVILTLSSATTTTSGNGPVVTLQLQSDADRIKVFTQLATSIGNTYLSLTATAIQDVSGSPVPPSNALRVSIFTEDTTPPELLSFTLDLDIGSLQLTFSEAVDPSTLDPTGITLQSSPVPAATSFTLTGVSAVAVSFTEMMLKLTMDDANTLRQIQGLATSVVDTYLALTSATIQDYSGNSLVPIPSSNAIPVTLPHGCPFEYDVWNIPWGFTEPGTSAMQPCGRTYLGNVSRVCYENATWAEPDVSGCQSRQFQGLKETAEELFSEESVNISAVLDLVDVLTEATAPDTNMRSLFPSDLNTTNVILTGTIDSLIDDFNQTGTADPEQSVSIVDVINNVLHEKNQAGWEMLQRSDVGSQALLNNAERFAIFVARNETAENVTISRDNIVLQARQVAADRDRNFEDIYFPTMDELDNAWFDVQQSTVRIRIPGVLLAERAQQSHTIPVANILFRNLELFLPNSLKVVVSNGNTLVPKSSIISSQVGTQSGDSQALLEDPVEINFILRLGENDTNPRCVFWDFGDTLGNGAWSTDGLQRTDDMTNGTIIQCNSTHLTSFAILVNVGGSVDDRVLEFITYIGCGVSVVCLLFSIVFFLTAGKNLFQKPHNFIHLNLCVALMLGYGLFVGGTDFARHIPWLCTSVAALLHYLFLAVFCWMLCEGIMLFLMLVIVFSTLAKRWWFFLLIGWGLPIVFVAVGLGIRLDQYGTQNYCWISTNVKGVIWFFVGPMVAIILVNVIILIMVLIRLFKTLKRRGARTQMKDDKPWMKKQFKIAKKLLVGSIALLPLLGITWVLGLFAVNENTLLFAYLFTIFNSLQGLFIFFFYVLRDERLCGRKGKFCSCCPHSQVSTKETGVHAKKDTPLGRNLLSDNSAPESPQELDEKVELSMSESLFQPLCPADQAV